MRYRYLQAGSAARLEEITNPEGLRHSRPLFAILMANHREVAIMAGANDNVVVQACNTLVKAPGKS